MAIQVCTGSVDSCTPVKVHFRIDLFQGALSLFCRRYEAICKALYWGRKDFVPLCNGLRNGYSQCPPEHVGLECPDTSVILTTDGDAENNTFEGSQSGVRPWHNPMPEIMNITCFIPFCCVICLQNMKRDLL